MSSQLEKASQKHRKHFSTAVSCSYFLCFIPADHITEALKPQSVFLYHIYGYDAATQKLQTKGIIALVIQWLPKYLLTDRLQGQKLFAELKHNYDP